MTEPGRQAINDRGHVAADVLDHLRLRLLSPELEAVVREHLDACSRCREAYEQLHEDCRHFEHVVLPRALPRLRAQTRRRWRDVSSRPWLAAAGLVAALLVLAVIFAPFSREPTVRVKGDPTWQVVAKRGDAVFRVTPGVRLRPKDRIRFVVEPAGAKYLLIVSRDGAGQMSLYHPVGGLRSAALPQGRVELPGSIELDDAPGPERLVAIFSGAPLAAPAVLATIERAPPPLAHDTVAGATHVLVLELEKEIP